MTDLDTIRRLPRVGDRIRVQRDEIIHRPRGTWPRWRGRVGTVVVVNRDRKRPGATEYGVVFGATRARSDGRGELNYSEAPVWFLGHELAVLAP